MNVKDPLEEVKPESGPSVRIGNHNFSDSSFEESFQNGFKSGSVIVESTTDVCDDLMIFKLLKPGFEEVNLLFKVLFLFSVKEKLFEHCILLVVCSFEMLQFKAKVELFR